MAIINKVTAAILGCAALLSITPAANASLIALYTYDNASNLGLDSSGNGNNLKSSTTAPTTTTGKYGSALNLAGASDLYSTSGTLASLPIGNSSYTISSWINPSVNNNGGIVGWGNYNNYNQTDAFRLNGNGLVNYWWSNDLNATAPTDLFAGTGATGWHFVAATYDAGTGINNIYIDGAVVATRTVTSGPNVAGTNFAVGLTNGNEFFNGQMDNTAIFNTALTLSQLNTISLNNFSAFTTNNVPEPGSIMLLSIGILAVLGASRRKQSA